MIEVNLEDFEIYRASLKKYALSLLKTRGFGNHKKLELEELAKDIIQNSYIRFQSSRLDVFIDKFHFENFLRLCLYRSYQDEVDYRCKNFNWILFKKGEFDQLDLSLHPKVVPTVEQFDLIEKFKKDLNENQVMIVSKLLDGYSQAEIAKEKNISRQAVSDSISYLRKIYNGSKDS